VSAFVDTSGIVALLDRRQARHLRALEFMEQYGNERLVTHAAVVIESTALIDRRLGVEATTQFVDQLLPTIAVFHGTELTYERALATYRFGTGRRRPSLVDCLAFETMRELQIRDAFTFDEDFERAGFHVVPAT
jgi:predicted nucleic acid-binding protein